MNTFLRNLKFNIEIPIQECQRFIESEVELVTTQNFACMYFFFHFLYSEIKKLNFPDDFVIF